MLELVQTLDGQTTREVLADPDVLLALSSLLLKLLDEAAHAPVELRNAARRVRRVEVDEHPVRDKRRPNELEEWRIWRAALIDELQRPSNVEMGKQQGSAPHTDAPAYIPFLP